MRVIIEATEELRPYSICFRNKKKVSSIILKKIQSWNRESFKHYQNIIYRQMYYEFMS